MTNPRATPDEATCPERSPVPPVIEPRPGRPSTLRTAAMALRTWAGYRWVVAAIAALAVAVLIGVPTVLIPNPVFGREIPTEPWNYPVWLVASVLTGLLVATYVRPGRAASSPTGTEGEADDRIPEGDGRDRRLGSVGAVLAWFAVGCPVCNKLALLAFGYSGAITWFAPAQPYLAGAAIGLSGWALVRRLEGEVSCAVPAAPGVEP